MTSVAVGWKDCKCGMGAALATEPAKGENLKMQKQKLLEHVGCALRQRSALQATDVICITPQLKSSAAAPRASNALPMDKKQCMRRTELRPELLQSSTSFVWGRGYLPWMINLSTAGWSIHMCSRSAGRNALQRQAANDKRAKIHLYNSAAILGHQRILHAEQAVLLVPQYPSPAPAPSLPVPFTTSILCSALIKH